MLDGGELLLLRKQVALQFKWQRGFSFCVSLAFVALYFTTNIYPAPITIFLMSAGALFMVLFVVWLLTDQGSWLRRYKSLQLDLSSGIVHRFQSSESGPALEVLPRSEVVFSSSGKLPRKWRRVIISEVAKTPPIASIATEWLLPVEGIAGKFFSGKRNLSVAERDEIRRWAGQVLDQRRRYAFTYVCWAAVVYWLSRGSSLDLFYAALAVTGYAAMRIYSEIRLYYDLRRDADDGIVVINCRAKVEDGSLKPVGSASEFLPAARLKWTEGGFAAKWRKLL
jgi:hypothetical protein